MNLALVLLLYMCIAAILVKLSGAIGSLLSEYEKVSSIIVRNEHNSFNAVYRIIFPVVCVFVISNIFAYFNVNLKYNFLIVVIFWIFRIVFVIAMKRLLLSNNAYIFITAISSISLSVCVYLISQKDGEFFLPEKGDLVSQFWIIVAVFVYNTFNEIQKNSGNIFKRRKKLEEYVKTQLKEFLCKFKNTIFSVTEDKHITEIILSIMVVENFNRPSTLRYFENIFPSLFKTKGIMQVTHLEKLSDVESVKIGSELIKEYYMCVIQTYSSDFKFWMVKDIAKKYNCGDDYAEMVKEVYDIISQYDFMPESEKLSPQNH